MIEMKELNEIELLDIDGGAGLPWWAGFIDAIYDLGYGIGQGFAHAAKSL